LGGGQSWLRQAAHGAAGGAWRAVAATWRFSQEIDWVVQVIPQHAIEVIPVLSTRKMAIRRQELGWYFLLRRQVFTLCGYGGVLWSGELQGFIVHEM
jgi:hypothetical protein